MVMNIKYVWVAVACAGLLGQASAQGKADIKDFGKREFESNCASCHGRDGKGKGPIVDLLRKPPPDLTQLSKKNGGVFPMERLYNVIEGADVSSHGDRDMPVWGRDYEIEAGEYYMDIPYDPQAYVRARILGLLEYISRLQDK